MFLNTLRRNKIVRSVAIPAYRRYSKLYSSGDGPKICVVSIPKAGTHLVSRVLNNAPKVIFSGYHLSEENIYQNYPGVPELTDLRSEFSEALRKCCYGQYITLHTPFDTRIKYNLEKLDMRIIFVVREPRDILVSYVNYVLREKRHFHHEYFNSINDFDSLLELTIIGFASNRLAALGLPPINDVLQRYKGWAEAESVTVIRYEDLIGVKGGGNKESQMQAVRSILSVVGEGDNSMLVGKLTDRVYSEGSVTFSKGKTQQWRQNFSESNQRLFNETAAHEAKALGY